MKQPINGILATSGIVILSLLFISLFSKDFFAGWVAFAMMACIPSQIVLGLVWQTNYPAAMANLPQPIKGLGFTALSMLGGCIFAPAMFYTVGGGYPPTPQLMMFTILTVIMTFWLVGVWQCQPFSNINKHPLFIGIAVLLASYGLAYLVFNSLFDFAFLRSAPIHIESLDPKGAFMAWQVLAFGVTTVAVIMLCILSDFWPMSRLSSSNALLFSLLSSGWILCLSAAVFFVATNILNIDVVVYMVRGPVSFIFGAFILLNMLQNSSFVKIQQQPIRGLLQVLLAIALAAVMQNLYHWASGFISGALPSGPGTYELELWLANAMLAVTFPLIVMHSDFLNLWPLGKRDTVVTQELNQHG